MVKKNNKKILIIVLSLIIIGGVVFLFVFLTQCNNKKKMTNIQWTNDTFEYDGEVHCIEVTGYPVDSTVTYTGGLVDGNGASSQGTFEIKATITNAKYATWTGTHDLNIVLPDSYIVLLDGTYISINTSYNGFLTNRTNSGTFNFQDNKGVDQTIDRSQISHISLTHLPETSSTPDNYLQYMCYNMTNLNDINIDIPQSITSTGVNFCYQMFRNCTSLTTLTNISSGISLPQSITTVGNSFCVGMFQGCTQLQSLGNNFIIPSTIDTVGGTFCSTMFQDCGSLTSLPSGFTIPHGITSGVGNGFCSQMFQGCSSLASIPSNFNIPQGITSVGQGFCYGMFQNCTSLKNDHAPANLVTIHIPNFTGSSYCTNMFNNTGTSNPTTPSPDTDVTINKN